MPSHVLARVRRAVLGFTKPTHRASEVEEGAGLGRTLAKRMEVPLEVPPSGRRVRIDARNGALLP